MQALFKYGLIFYFFISSLYAQSNEHCIQLPNKEAIAVSHMVWVKENVTLDFSFPKNFDDARNLDAIGLLPSSSAWWAKLCIRNNSNEVQKTSLFLGNWMLQNATVYHFKNELLLDTVSTGFQVPASKKKLSLGYYQVAPLTLPPKSTSEILILFKPFKFFPIAATPSIMTNEKMVSLLLQRRTMLSISLGILFIMLFYSLSLFIKLGGSVYLYYFLHLLGGLINLLAWNGLLAAVLGDGLIFQYPLWQIVTLSSWIFYILFLVHVIDGSSLAKWFKKRRLFFIAAGSLFYLTALFFLFIKNDLYRSSLVFISQALLFAILVLFISFKLLKKKDKASQYFLLGSICLATGILYNLFSELFFETHPTRLLSDPNTIIIVVLVIEMIFFMLGLAEKMKQAQIKSALQKAKVLELLNQMQSLKLLNNIDFNDSGLERLHEQLTPFVKKCLEVISKNLENLEFSVAKFSNEMFISRVHLHRRLKAELGMSASETIRWVRLTFASNLLKTSDLNVTEVSYKSGFNNLSYFAKCFRKQYGVNPSEFRK